MFIYSTFRYEPSEMLLNVYETVYKIRSTLLAHKNSPRTSQVQTAPKQVPLLQFLLLFFAGHHIKRRHNLIKTKTRVFSTFSYLQTIISPQSPDADRQEPSTSMEQAEKDHEQQARSHCSREVQVPPTPTANHNQEEVTEEDTFGNSRMYLSG